MVRRTMGTAFSRAFFCRPAKNWCEPRSVPGRWAGPRGFSTIELLIVMVLLVLIMTVSIPAVQRFYLQSQVNSGAATVESMIHRARMSALKEKIAYRVLIHDESALTPNTVELQRDESGSFITITGEVQTLPRSIRILGSGSTNSLDSMTVNSRGQCTSGTVFVTHDGANIGVVKIASTCFTTAS
jgi:type II secretory pathway pseudopilin PulG